MGNLKDEFEIELAKAEGRDKAKADATDHPPQKKNDAETTEFLRSQLLGSAASNPKQP